MGELINKSRLKPQMSITRAATLLFACTTAHAVRVGVHDALTPHAEQLLAEIEGTERSTSLDEGKEFAEEVFSDVLDEMQEDGINLLELFQRCDEYLGIPLTRDPESYAIQEEERACNRKRDE